jgi:hypothetical protein
MDEFKHELFSLPSEFNNSSFINHNNITEGEPIKILKLTVVSKIACSEKVTYSIDEALQHLTQLCDKAIDTEDRTNQANQEEILC